MIQNLIEQIINLLRESFVGVIADPENQIVAGPVTEPVGIGPTIAIYPANLEMSQNFKETNSSQPRPQEFRQEIAVNESTPQGPYSLAKTPLQRSTLCKVIFDQGILTERKIMLVEDKDFTINYQGATILFSYDLAEASSVRLKYSFVGVFTVREFQQEFLADIYDDDKAAVEKWASLTTAMILTSHDELVEGYNLIARTEYVANRFTTSHTIGQIQVLEGVLGRSDSTFSLQLKYNVAGQVKLTKEIVDGFGLIERIHSPGRISEHPVDIDIGVE